MLLEGLRGIAPADTGFIALPLQPAQLVKTCARGRKLMETVGSYLTERFGVGRMHVHDLWHYPHRLMRKVLAHTVAVFLNLKLGRQPLDLDGLVMS